MFFYLFIGDINSESANLNTTAIAQMRYCGVNGEIRPKMHYMSKGKGSHFTLATLAAQWMLPLLV